MVCRCRARSLAWVSIGAWGLTIRGVQGHGNKGGPRWNRERSAAAARLALPGFVVLAVADYAGEWEQAIETTADLVGCPKCGAVAQLHDRRPTWCATCPRRRPVTLVWVKRIWRCPHGLCLKRTWTQTSEAIAPQVLLTERARTEICRRVGQDAASVATVARKFGIGWRTAMTAVRDFGTARGTLPGPAGVGQGSRGG